MVLRRAVRNGGRVLGPLGVLAAAVASLLVPGGTLPASAATGKPSTSANLLKNGCMGDPKVNPSHGAARVPGGSTQITNWSVPKGDGALFIAPPSYNQAPPGCTQSVILGGGNSISQVVTTTPGFSYLIQWYLAAHQRGTPDVRLMEVFWGGRNVVTRRFNMASSGASHSDMHWTAEQVIVGATGKSTELTFQDTSPDANGSEIGAASLTPLSEIVNGFIASNSNGPYAAAVRHMLDHIPGAVLVGGSGKPVCSLQAVTANQVKTRTSGAGVLIVWAIAPTAYFVHERSTARLASARLVATYLVGLLKRSRNAYLASLQAGRIPPKWASWWAVEVQSVSTTGLPMSFEVALAGTAVTMQWDVIFGVSSTKPSLAPQALTNLLYHTNKIATGPN